MTKRVFNHVLVLLVVFAWGRPSHAHRINVDCDDGNGVPESTYGAAGRPGIWNEVSSSEATMLVDALGQPTGVTVSLLPIGSLFTGFTDAASQSTTGNDRRLLYDYCYSHSNRLDARIEGLEAGHYEIITYTLGRQDVEIRPSTVWINDEVTLTQAVFGDWEGTLAAGVTHARHVARALDGTLVIHLEHLGDAFINGFQIGPSSCLGDLDEDGTVGFEDLSRLLETWGGCDDLSCGPDLDANSAVGFSDLMVLIGRWGSC